MLADAVEKFRNRCLENYGLCPRHYFRAPALSSNAMLSIIEDKLDLYSDVDMHILFEKEMRSGVSYISKTCSEASNKYLTSYDSNILGQKNLYGYAMPKSLPASRFKWLNPEKINLDECDSNRLRGCVLDVDLEYPTDLQKLHMIIF